MRARQTRIDAPVAAGSDKGVTVGPNLPQLRAPSDLPQLSGRESRTVPIFEPAPAPEPAAVSAASSAATLPSGPADAALTRGLSANRLGAA